MTGNFEFLKNKKEFRMFAEACIDAENVADSAPALSVTGARKALELAVKWLYSADCYMCLPGKYYTLQDLLHERCFMEQVDVALRKRIQYIVRMGNYGVHTNNKYTIADSHLCLSILFDFVEWIDYCYGNDYEERSFDEKRIPGSAEENAESVKHLKDELQAERDKTSELLEEKDKRIASLMAELEEKSKEITRQKEKHQKERKEPEFEDLSEFETRKKYIDADLRMLGWKFSNEKKRDCVETEFEVHGMPKADSTDGKGTGYVDYVLFGDNGDIIALIEAKRTSFDAKKGTHQAELYNECIKLDYGLNPIIFNTNGFDTYLWDKGHGVQRPVSGLFSKDDILHLINLRSMRKPLNDIVISDEIAGRYYQKAAVRAVCENIEKDVRRSLIVMATGTGKTRVAASLTDVLSRAGYVTNVLFLADRKSLVRQAKNSFVKHLGDEYSYCNLVENKDDRNARIVFSTYPTMMNAINAEKRSEGDSLFTEGHFDLIFIDEAHRSIFNKYRALFDYFDAYIVGLTATPKDIDSASTYQFFNLSSRVPTALYTYDEAVNKDHVLVPYINIETFSKFMTEGIAYDDLSEAEKEAYEDEFTDEEDNMEDYQPSEKLNKVIFNSDTVDKVLNDLMTKGVKDAGGNHVGKTIIFAQNKNHAKFIVDRFNTLYPEYNGTFARYVTCTEDYSDNLIERFKDPDGEPVIIVSVDMMDTGVDVPEVVNLVFFKKVKSRIKFLQMIGRGTRICKDLFGKGRDKEFFYIFDYLSNFEFFREEQNGKESGVTDSVVTMLFRNRASIISLLQSAEYMDDDIQKFRTSLIEIVTGQINELVPERIDVKQNRRYVEKMKDIKAFQCLTDKDLSELHKYIAPLVSEKGDDDALTFDNLMLSVMLDGLRSGKGAKRYRKYIQGRAQILLDKKMTIPMVKEKAAELKKAASDEYWTSADILELERLRISLRDIMKFAHGEGKEIHYTDFKDEWSETVTGKEFDMGENYEDYFKKVNSYITEHMDMLPIYKLRHNQALSEYEFSQLEKLLTEQLGTKADYERTFSDTPLGKIVRSIAKMDHEAVMDLFSSYIDEEKWDQRQIAFVRTVISYVEDHGSLEPSILMKPPFDRPARIIDLFKEEDQKNLIGIIRSINDNAVKPA